MDSVLCFMVFLSHSVCIMYVMYTLYRVYGPSCVLHCLDNSHYGISESQCIYYVCIQGVCVLDCLNNSHYGISESQCILVHVCICRVYGPTLVLHCLENSHVSLLTLFADH